MTTTKNEIARELAIRLFAAPSREIDEILDEAERRGVMKQVARAYKKLQSISPTRH